MNSYILPFRLQGLTFYRTSSINDEKDADNECLIRLFAFKDLYNKETYLETFSYIRYTLYK